jgi:hypothetical protein
VRHTVVVGVVGLLGPGLGALPLGHGLGGIVTLALAMPHDGLLNCPRRWVSRPVGVELRVIACGVVSRCFECAIAPATYPAARKCSVLKLAIDPGSESSRARNFECGVAQLDSVGS